MTSLHWQTLLLPGAGLGEESPFPPLPGETDLHVAEPSSEIPDDIAEGLTYGRPSSILPYSMQDGYFRQRHDMELRTLVLDNGILRAQIVPELGGRLWSLVHIPSGRELLYRNPVLQPANLALRNAWFSGGVEWNVSTIGHSPLTCSPMHAASTETDDGPLLRLWEFERLREVVFHVDFMLPDGSDFLYVGVRVVNPHDTDVPMYWWSNIAVPQRNNTRVLAPATRSYRFSYGEGLGVIPAPVHDGHDYTFPEQARTAADYFFDIPPKTQPWIAAVDADGHGLVHTSTQRLRGRKLFVWGTGRGGRRWQNWLTEDGSDEYLEIQAGLAQTQLEHLRMPPATSWSWIEAYGPITIDNSRTHTDAWDEATGAVAADISNRMPPATLSSRHERWRSLWRREPQQILQAGSGWGALEQKRRRVCGQRPLDEPGMPFADSTLGDAQQPWQRFLETGRLEQPSSSQAPAAFVSGPQWRRLLDCAELAGDWHGLYLRGVAASADDDPDAAYRAWRASCAARPNPWALRCLAAADSTQARDAADPDAAQAAWARACERYLQAAAMLPNEWRLIAEAAATLIAADRSVAALELIAGTSRRVREHGRVQLQQLRAAVAAGDVEIAQSIFESDFQVVDLREGEVSLDELWFDFVALREAGDSPVTPQIRRRAAEKHPLPARFDFRMHD